jgi:uncharacterized protein YtpQ (UPF0354 family)
MAAAAVEITNFAKQRPGDAERGCVCKTSRSGSGRKPTVEVTDPSGFDLHECCGWSRTERDTTALHLGSVKCAAPARGLISSCPFSTSPYYWLSIANTMKRFIQIMLAALGICSGCSKSDLLTPSQFTAEFAEVLRKASPGTKVEIVRDMEVKVTPPGADGVTSFLDNAYDLYKQNPSSKDDIIKRFVASNLETIANLQSAQVLDRTRIVPVIKDRPWLDDTRKALINRGTKKALENVYDELNSDLIILYGEDSAKNISYFGPKDLEKAHIDRNELRGLACENLKRLLPKIERLGTNGLYMITAGGDYEASLLLLDSVWTGLEKEVHGEVVVAIPTRDLLVVSGSEDTEGIAKMKQIVLRATAKGAYRLTTKLFVRHNGAFNEFKEAAGTVDLPPK